MWRKALILLVAAACGPTGSPPAAGMIEVTHSDIYRSATTQVFASGRIVQTRSAQGAAPETEVLAGSPRAFAAAARLLQEEGARVKAAADTVTTCKSYGTDLIRATPPVGVFDEVATFCADPGVTALMQRLYGVLGVAYDD